jgi:hypothetical protein
MMPFSNLKVKLPEKPKLLKGREATLLEWRDN